MQITGAQHIGSIRDKSLKLGSLSFALHCNSEHVRHCAIESVKDDVQIESELPSILLQALADSSIPSLTKARAVICWVKGGKNYPNSVAGYIKNLILAFEKMLDRGHPDPCVINAIATSLEFLPSRLGMVMPTCPNCNKKANWHEKNKVGDFGIIVGSGYACVHCGKGIM